jgi:hypothetical protein
MLKAQKESQTSPRLGGVSPSRANEFKEHLQSRGLSPKAVDFSIAALEELENYLIKNGKSFASLTLDDLKRYISLLIKERRNSEQRLDAIARYLAFAGKNAEFIYLIGTCGAYNVLPDIGDRLASIAGEKARHRIFERFGQPALGSPQDMFPPLTARIMKRMEEELPPTACRQILTWNYHKIPAEAFKEAKERFEKASSIDEYLKGEHKRLVDIMERCIKQGGLWYEQQITPEVLDFVKANQEITTGIRNGEWIYVTKIPYAPERYLAEKDPMMKRYYACHCQLARTAIRDGKPKISPTFCYCSAGFTKTKFDTVFGEPVEVELFESALKGDMRCRFAVRIPRGKMK